MICGVTFMREGRHHLSSPAGSRREPAGGGAEPAEHRQDGSATVARRRGCAEAPSVKRLRSMSGEAPLRLAVSTLPFRNLIAGSTPPPAREAKGFACRRGKRWSRRLREQESPDVSVRALANLRREKTHSSSSSSSSSLPEVLSAAPRRPALARMADSILAAMSGFSARKAFAFSRPCPMRWLS